jgi:hypothetical protein
VVGTVRAAWAGLALGLAFGVASVSPLSVAAVAESRATTAVCLGAEATIVGTRGDDDLVGTNGPDVIVGGRGGDTIRGRGGDDLICGRSGDDVIDGGSGDDRVLGFHGEDEVRGGPGDDSLVGGPQADRLFGEAGDDRLDGGPAFDHCDGGDGTNLVTGCEDTPNDPPVAVDDSASGDEDTSTSVAVLANDTDPDGDALQVSSVETAGTKGTVAVSSGGAAVTYDPHGQFDALKPGQSGTDSFGYTVSDGQGGSDTATVSVTVAGVDDAPRAVDDTATVAEDASATTVDVRANDTDVDAGPRTITGVTQPAHGTVAITHAGDDLSYLPNPDFCNSPPPSDDFTYTLNGDSVGHVSLTVTCVNDAPVVDLDGTSGPNTTASFTEDGGPASVAPNANLTDVDAGATLASATITLTNHPDNATESLAVTIPGGNPVTTSSYDSGTGVLTLTGHGATVAQMQAVVRSLKYNNTSNTPDLTSRVVNVKVNDGTADSNEPHSTVTVTAHNDAPTATDQNASTNEDTPKAITLAGTDPDGDTLTFTHLAPAHGNLTGTGANLTYQGVQDYCGPDIFTFTADDGHGGTNDGTVTLTVTCVNDAPVVDLDGTTGPNTTASFSEDGAAASVAPNANLTDADTGATLATATITLTNPLDNAAESLEVTIPGSSPVTASSYNSGTGVLTLTGNGATVAQMQAVIRSLKYNNTSNTPNLTSRVVDVQVNDGTADSNTPHSTITVTAHNDAPTATDQTGLTTNEDTAKAITLAGTDPEGDSLTFASDQPSHGSVSPTTGSAVTYTPTLNYCGPDSFGFTVDDGHGGTNNGTVTLTVACVNDAPTVDLDGTSGPDTTASFTEDGAAASVAPNANVTDADTGATLATATITLTNHPDNAAELLAVTIPGGSPVTTSGYDSGTGVLTLTGNGATVAQMQTVLRSLTYDNTSNSPNTTAARVVDVQVNDGTADSNKPHSTITITPHNDAPTATGQSGLSTNEDTPLAITLAGTDPESDPLTFASDQPAHGSVSPTTGSGITYTPAGDYCGPDSFTFHTNDGTVDSPNGTISITVSCVNDAPVVDLDGTTGPDTTASFTEDGAAASVAPNATLTDADTGATLATATITLTNHPDNAAESLAVTLPGGTNPVTTSGYDSGTGVLTLTGNGATVAQMQAALRSLKYNNTSNTPNTTAARVVDVQVNDGTADSNKPHSTITITAHNDAPTATDQTGLSTNEDTGLPITLAGTDPDGDSLTFASDQPSHGSVSPTTGSGVTYTPVGDYCGPDSFKFHTNDGTANSADATVSITVTCVNDAPRLDLNGGGTGSGNTVTFNETDPHNASLAVAIADSAATLTDPENDNVTGATIELTPRPDNTSESLSVNVGGTGIDAHGGYDSASGKITLSGSAPTADYLQVIKSVKYDNTKSLPDPSDRTVHVTLTDGTTAAAPVDGTVKVRQINELPVVDLDSSNAGSPDSSAAFTEGATPVQIAPNTAVSDTDDANLTSAEVTITNLQDGTAESLDATLGATGITKSYNPTTGTLTLSGSHPVADYETVLKSVTYSNSSDAPSATARLISVKVNDGQDDSDPRTATVSITPTNDPPQNGTPSAQTTNEDTPLTFSTANGNALSVSDVDSGSNPIQTTLSVSHGTLTASTVGGVTITSNGTASVTLSGSATNITTSLSGLTYTPASNFNTSSASEALHIVTDDQGNSPAPAQTDTDDVAITVTAVNDAPVVDMNGGGGGIDSGPVAFTEDSSPNVVGSGPVNLGASATVADVDNATLASATLTLTNHPDGVNESLSVTIPGGNPITTGGYNASTGVLQLTGNGATTAQFQTVIQSVKYNNVSNTPDPTNRDITTKVNDGAADSTLAHTTVTVAPTNDAPVAADETFNGTSSAVGNTTLSVNDATSHGGPADGRMATPDPTDTAPMTDRPHKEITGDIIGNDTDPESANSALTITAGTFQTKNASTNANDGGSVTVEADGDFLFEPPPGCPAVNSYFDYTLQDSAGTNPGTDTGRVTIASAGCVWYVNNNDAQGNSGTSEKPFDTIAQAETASGANQTIFVYDGNDSTTGYNTGILMDANQQLLSEAATLTIGSDTLHTADSANKASLTNNNADVVTLAGGATVEGFNIDPQGTGGGVFGTGLGATTITLDDLNITDTVTKGTQPGLELATNTGTTTNISNLTVNNGDGSSATTGDEGVRLSAAGTVNFASTGTISITTDGAAGLDAAAGAGTTSLGTASTFDDITVTNSGSGGVLLNGTTGSGTAFGNGAGNDLQLTTVSGTPAAFSVQTAGQFTVPSAGQSDISATGGPALDVVSPGTTAPGTAMAFDSVSSTNSSTTGGASGDGINLDSLGTATFSAATGDIGGESGIGFDLNGGSGTITYPGTFNNGSGTLVVEVTGRTNGAGAVSFSGSMFDTNDAGGGVNIANNTGGSTTLSGAMKQFNTGASDAVTFSNSDGHTLRMTDGGLDIDTGAGRALQAASSGTIEVSGSGNTINSGSGRALEIANTDIASTGGATPGGVTLQSISSNGASTGIVLNTTGSGPFAVTGNGGSCTGAASCSGGAIQNSSGVGVTLSGVPGGASFTRVQVSGSGDDGINGANVNGFALNNSRVASNGNSTSDDGVEMTQLSGTVGFDTTTVTASTHNNVTIANTSGNVTATFNGGTYSDTNLFATSGGDAILMRNDGTGTMTATVQNATFTNNRDDQFQATAGAASSGTLNVTVQSNTMTDTVGQQGNGITVNPGGTSLTHLTINNNNIQGSNQAAITVDSPGSAPLPQPSVIHATITNNTIGTAGVLRSGSWSGSAIAVNSNGGADINTLITGNQVRQYTNPEGITLVQNDGNGSLNATVRSNVVTEQANTINNLYGIRAIYGSTSTDNGAGCLDLGGAGAFRNNFTGSSPAGSFDIRLRQAGPTALSLPGYGGSAHDTAAVAAYLTGRNIAPQGSDVSQPDASATYSNAASCPLPSP